MGLKKSIAVGALLTVALCVGIAAGMQMKTASAAPAENSRVYELRTYTTNPGKLDDLHARFANHTNHLFVKHGITIVGYWTLDDGDAAENTLVYLIGHESREAAKANWRAFGADPAWREAYKASREDGALVNNIDSKFLNPTDYSPLR